MARRRAGQTQGGELIAIAMAAALILFVGREAIRTSRDTAAHRASQPPPPVVDTIVAAPTKPRPAPPIRVDSAALQPSTGSGKIDPAELRRRIDVGSPGTYIGDMLADRDSMLTRWPERTLEPVRVWIQRKGSFPDWTPELFGAARRAFDEWGEVGVPVRFTFTVDSANADIRVAFAERATERNRLGVTTHRRDKEGWIVGADVVVATHDTSGTVLPQSLIAAIARHEVGHALGLAHSKDRGTIMYPESQTLTITPVDRATLRLLYTLPAGSVK
jgi:hypothetical protein